MKRPDRTLNVFSLSALDLFASAMGTFVVLAVLLFPYYLKNYEVVAENQRLKQDLEATQDALQVAQAELEQAQAEAEAAQAAAQAAQQAAAEAQAENAQLRGRIAELQAQLEELSGQAAEAQARGHCDPSRWEYYAGARFVLYQCDSGNPNELLLVGIVYQGPNAGTNQLQVGDMALVARRRGNNLDGYWWTWNQVNVNCVYRGIAEEFTGTISPDGGTMTIRTANGVTEATGNRNRCIFERTRVDTLTIRRIG